MSRKQKEHNKTNLDRPFDASIMERATEIASQYQVVVRFGDGEYYGRGLELPGAMDDGKTPDECVEKTRQSMIAVVATMLENGDIPPAPASHVERKVQINVRMTAEEKLMIERAAKDHGFDGISEYIRASALTGAGITKH